MNPAHAGTNCSNNATVQHSVTQCNTRFVHQGVKPRKTLERNINFAARSSLKLSGVTQLLHFGGLRNGSPEAEEPQGVGGGDPSDRLQGHPHGVSHSGGDMGQEGGFVAFGSWLHVPWREVGGVGLEEQTFGWDLVNEGFEGLTAALVTDPAGDADEQAPLEVRLQGVLVPCETVDNAAGEVGDVAIEDRDHPLGRVALVQEHGELELSGLGQLPLEPRLLYGPGGEIAVEIQPALPHGDHRFTPSEAAEVRQRVRVSVRRVVGMDPRGAPERIWAGGGEGGHRHALGQVRACQHHPSDPQGDRAVDNSLAIAIEATMAQVQTDIDIGSVQGASGRDAPGSQVWCRGMSLSHFAVLLKPGFAFAAAKVVRADAHQERDGEHVLLREGEVVFQISGAYVHEMAGFPTHKEATERARIYREARAGAGAASAHITETGTAPRVHRQARRGARSGAVAEGLTVRVKE